jgi:hypothetical protein
MFVFRTPPGHESLSATRVAPSASSDYFFKWTIHHFSVSNDCVIIRANASEAIHFWLLPRDLCSGLNIVNIYGYSYSYALKLSSSNPVCMFFASFSASHHLALTSANANSSFEAKLYTATSLAPGGAPRKASTSRSVSFSSEDPFCARLSTHSSKVKTIYAEMASLQLPLLYANCRAEDVEHIEDVRHDGVRIRAEEVSDEHSINPINEIGTFWAYVALIAGITIAGLALMNWAGWISLACFRRWPCCAAADGPARALGRDTVIAFGPSDSI